MTATIQQLSKAFANCDTLLAALSRKVATLHHALSLGFEAAREVSSETALRVPTSNVNLTDPLDKNTFGEEECVANFASDWKELFLFTMIIRFYRKVRQTSTMVSVYDIRRDPIGLDIENVSTIQG
jgi:hypothetical protein